MSPEEAPWAFPRGKPNKESAALELLATLIGLMALNSLGGLGKDISGRIMVTAAAGLSDSSVASSVLTKSVSEVTRSA